MSGVPALLANHDAEAAVLSAMFCDDRAVHEAARVLSAAQFSRTAHERIFGAMLRLKDTGAAIDPLTVTAELQRTGELEECGGKDYLAALIDVVPTTANVVHHAKLVREAAQRRDMIALADDLKAGVADGQDARDLAQDATARLMPIAVERAGSGFQPLGELVGPVLCQIVSREGSTGTLGLPTGFPEIDEPTAGFRAGEMIILAGAPGSGKTAVALNIARNAASAGHRVAIFSAEATKAQLVERLFNIEARVSSSATRSGRLSASDGGRVADASSFLARLPLHIDDTPRPRSGDLIAKARHLKSRNPDLALVVVDYLQLVTPGRTRGRDPNRSEEITDIAYDLQALAKELSLPVLVLAQVDAKAAESREISKPLLRDLRWSQGPREAAHFVGLIHRPQADNPNAGSFLDIDFSKARDLPPFSVRLHWQGAWMRVATLRETTPALRVV